MRSSCLLLAPLVFALGCHSALNDAVAAYDEARYPAAAAQFRALGRAPSVFDANAFARYALYRGLSHLALGDARAAARWLGEAKRRADAHPELFDPRERGALLAAWSSMGAMPGEQSLAEAGDQPSF